jgi:hypothetical protein
MSVLWRIDHSALRIFATAQGSVARLDIETYVAEVIAQGAVGYQVVFDMRAASASLSRRDVAALSQVAKDRQRHERSDGRMALVAGSDAEREMGGYFADLTNHGRACRLFSSVEDAVAWLDQPSGSEK